MSRTVDAGDTCAKLVRLTEADRALLREAVERVDAERLGSEPGLLLGALK